MTPARLSLLQSELGLFTFGDLIQYFPFRYEDRTLLTPIAQINDQMENVQFIGRIKYKEKIKRGDVRKIVVNFRSINSPLPKIMDEAYYRIFIKECNVDVRLHDWTLLDSTNENFFTLNTSNYIPREYYVELKAKVNGDEIFYHDIIKFEILSEK
jgi:hypothetical protein